MEQANKVVARRIFEEVLNKGDLAVINELFLPDNVRHPASPGPSTRGNEEFGQFVTRLRTAFPDLHATVEDQIAEGDKVVTRFTMHGTHKGELTPPSAGTIAPTGKEVTYGGIIIHQFVDGKIAESWASVDLLGLYQQLGLIPPAPPPAARP